MGPLTESLRRLWYFLTRRRRARDLAREMAAHRAQMDDPGRFGSTVRLREQSWDIWGWSRLDDLIGDARHGIRLLTRNPGLACLAVLTLAVGIGATTAMFSVVNAVLLRPLPYADSSRVVWIWSQDTRRSLQQWTSYPDFMSWRDRSQTLAHLAGWGRYEAIANTPDGPVRIQAALTMGDLFGLLDVPPLVGTAREPASADVRAPQVVLSYGLWDRLLDANRQVVGRSITLNGELHTVVAVMPQRFRFPMQGEPVDAWILLPADQYNPALRNRRDARLIEVLGRLKPEATVEQAQAELDVIAVDLSREHPETNDGIGVRVVPALEEVTGTVSTALWVPFAAVTSVLLIACVNIANLLMTQAVTRRREHAIRAALGAGRLRLGLHVLIESLPLAMAGGTMGVLLALGALRLIVPFVPADLPRADEIAVDLPALGFAALASMLTAVAASLAPAWRVSSGGLSAMLGDAARTVVAPKKRRRVTDTLVVVEISVVTLLLAAAGLFLGSFWRLSQTVPAFDPHNVLTFEVNWAPRYSPDRAAEMFRELQSRLEAIPAVEAASVGLQLPDRGAPLLDDVLPFVRVEGQPDAANSRLRASVSTVQPRFFRTLRVPLVRGREFTVQDEASGPPVTVVNESLARTLFPGQDPIGRRLIVGSWTFFGERTLEIVGIARDVTHRGLRFEASPLLYLPLAQYPRNAATIAVRTTGDPLAIVGAVRAAVRSLDPDVPVDNVQTLERRLDRSLAHDRLETVLFGLFAGLALMLAMSGLYGVLSHAVAQRTQEIGIRLALGAGVDDVRRLVLRHGMTIACVGAILGLAAALAFSRILESLLFGVSATDPLTFVAAVLLLTLVALLACWIPARRATRIDPLTALRDE